MRPKNREAAQRGRSFIQNILEYDDFDDGERSSELSDQTDEEFAGSASDISDDSGGSETPRKKLSVAYPLEPEEPEVDESEIPPLALPPSSDDLLISSEYVMDAVGVYEVLRHYRTILRLSPFRFEDLAAALASEEQCSLLYEIHAALLRALLKEEDSNNTVFGPSDLKDSINSSFYFIDGMTYPELVRAYLASDKTWEYKAALPALSHVDFPFKDVRRKLTVLQTLTDLFLRSNPVREDLMNEGRIQYDDHCRACHKLGDLLCCEGCSAVYHLDCIDPPLEEIPEVWTCTVCREHKVEGVADCITTAEKDGSLSRHEPLGYDRFKRKYWFLVRRILVEAEDGATCIYSTRLQYEALIEHLDADKWEKHLVQALKGVEEELLRQMALTEKLTNDLKGVRKSYLESENKRLQDLKEVKEKKSADAEPMDHTSQPTEVGSVTSEMSVNGVVPMDSEEQIAPLSPLLNNDGLPDDLLLASQPESSQSLLSQHEQLTASEQRSASADMSLGQQNGTSLLAQAAEQLGDSLTSTAGAVLESAATPGKSAGSTGGPQLLCVNSAFPGKVLMQKVICSDGKTITTPVTLGVAGAASTKPVATGAGSTKPTLQTMVLVNKDGSKVTLALATPTLGSAIVSMSGMSPVSSSSTTSTISASGPSSGEANSPETGKYVTRSRTGSLTPKLFADSVADITGSVRMLSHIKSGQRVEADQSMRFDRTKQLPGTQTTSASATAAVQPFKLGMEGSYKTYKNQYVESSLALNKHQHNEERDRKRHLAHKFNLMPLNEFSWDGSIFGSRAVVLSTLRQTFARFEASIPQVLLHANWPAYRQHWLNALQMCTRPLDFATALAVFAANCKPVLFTPVWNDSLGHTSLVRTTMQEKDDGKKKERQSRRRIAAAAAAAAEEQPQPAEPQEPRNVVWIKYTLGLRHQVFKFKGEEYRISGGVGWRWVSATRLYRFKPFGEVGLRSLAARLRRGAVCKTTSDGGPDASSVAAPMDVDQNGGAGVGHPVGGEQHDVRSEVSSDTVPPFAPDLSSCDVIDVSRSLVSREFYRPLLSHQKPASKLDGLLALREQQVADERLRAAAAAAAAVAAAAAAATAAAKSKPDSKPSLAEPAVLPVPCKQEVAVAATAINSGMLLDCGDGEAKLQQRAPTAACYSPTCQGADDRCYSFLCRGLATAAAAAMTAAVHGASAGALTFVGGSDADRKPLISGEASKAVSAGPERPPTSAGEAVQVEQQCAADGIGATAAAAAVHDQGDSMHQCVGSGASVTAAIAVGGSCMSVAPESGAGSAAAAAVRAAADSLAPAPQQSEALAASTAAVPPPLDGETVVVKSEALDEKPVVLPLPPVAAAEASPPQPAVSERSTREPHKLAVPLLGSTPPAGGAAAGGGSVVVKGKKSRQPNLHPHHKFETAHKRRSLFVINKYELRRLSRRAGMREATGFRYDCKLNTVQWPYPCARPRFRTAWEYRTQLAASYAAVAIQLRLLWACTRWDDLSVKPPPGGTNTVSTETEITTKELLQRRPASFCPSGLRSEYLVRTIVIPLQLAQEPKQEAYRSYRTGLRQRKQREDPTPSQPTMVETWVPEESLELWELKLFGDQQAQKLAATPATSAGMSQGNRDGLAGLSSSASHASPGLSASGSGLAKLTKPQTSEEMVAVKAQIEEQLKAQRLAMQQKRVLSSDLNNRPAQVLRVVGSGIIGSNSAAATATAAALSSAAGNKLPLPKSLIRTVPAGSPSLQTGAAQVSGLGGASAAGSLAAVAVAALRPKQLTTVPVTVASNIRTITSAGVTTSVSPVMNVATAVRGQLPMQIRPQILAKGVTPTSPQNYVARTTSGEIYIRSLAPNQQILRLPDGRLSVVNLQPSATLTALGSRLIVPATGGGGGSAAAAATTVVAATSVTLTAASAGSIASLVTLGGTQTARVLTPVSSTAAAASPQALVVMTNAGSPVRMVVSSGTLSPLVPNLVQAVSSQTGGLTSPVKLVLPAGTQLPAGLPLLSLSEASQASSSMLLQQQPATAGAAVGPAASSGARRGAAAGEEPSSSSTDLTAAGVQCSVADTAAAAAAGDGKVSLSPQVLQQVIAQALLQNQAPEVQSKLLAMQRQLASNAHRQPLVAARIQAGTELLLQQQQLQRQQLTQALQQLNSSNRAASSEQSREEKTVDSTTAAEVAQKSTSAASVAVKTEKRSKAMELAAQRKEKQMATRLQGLLNKQKEALKHDMKQKRDLLEQQLRQDILATISQSQRPSPAVTATARPLTITSPNKVQLSAVTPPQQYQQQQVTPLPRTQFQLAPANQPAAVPHHAAELQPAKAAKRNNVMPSRSGAASRSKRRKTKRPSDNFVTDDEDEDDIPVEEDDDMDEEEEMEPVAPSKRRKDEKLYCVCRTPYDDTEFYVGCDLCSNWFHGRCINVSEDDAKEIDSYICDECKVQKDSTQEELYCVCRTPYNESEFYVGCDQCQGWYHGRCVGVTKAEADLLATYVCPNCRKASKGAPARDVTTRDAIPLGESEVESLKKLVKSLQTHKMAWPFRIPVSAADVPGYYEVIKEPMDLTTLATKLKMHQYKTLGEFVKDVNKIFNNCRYYNPSDSPFFQCAEVLEAFFVQKLKEFKGKL